MAYQYPPGIRKYEITGALFGEPYRVARCGTADLDVAEGAEIVIEGKILNEVREPEGPFSGSTGFASYRSTENVFAAERIQMRRDPCFTRSRRAQPRITFRSGALPTRAKS